MKKVMLAFLLFPAAFLASCDKEERAPEQHLFSGVKKNVGNGQCWSWVETDKSDKLKAVGISFEKSAFTGLPEDSHAPGGGHSHELEYVLPLPLQRNMTVFDHVAINWNPSGHPPEKVYTSPHFDLHFYMISEAERNAIPSFETDSSGFKQYPAPAYLPANYFAIPGGEAKMGVHWADATSPELSRTNPQPFTQTFIYGSYKGAVTYYEPMATLAFLTSTSNFTRDIPQPEKVAKDGYYPTKMSVMEKESRVEITLHNFVFRTKS